TPPLLALRAGCPDRASAVTDRAAGQSLDVVALDQLAAALQLVRRRLPGHVVNLLPRAHVALRLAVAVQAPLHVQRGVLPRQRHPVDRAVTGRAAHALLDVDAVVEVGEVGQVIHARPGEGLAAAVALADGLQQRAVDPDLVVAVHAGARRRQAGEG